MNLPNAGLTTLDEFYMQEPKGATLGGVYVDDVFLLTFASLFVAFNGIITSFGSVYCYLLSYMITNCVVLMSWTLFS